jgi:transketolase
MNGAAYLAGRGVPSLEGGDAAERVRRIGNEVRRLALRAVSGHEGHAGGDLSAADILATLYFAVLRVDPSNTEDPERDRFILSKGHAAGALYATLALAGFMPIDELDTFLHAESRLSGHPSRRHLPFIEASTGPLGHGLPVAVGTALGGKLAGSKRRTFVLTGDGELDEGSNWEAIMLASHFRLANLTLIVDRNGLQQTTPTETTVRLEPLAAKFRAFGWAVQSVDGHNAAALIRALSSRLDRLGRPRCVLAKTTKGRGVSFMEDRPEWHNRLVSPGDLKRALEELDEATDGRTV